MPSVALVAHHARIRWLRPDEGGRAAPPPGPTYSTVARFEAVAHEWPDAAWSIVLDRMEPPDHAGYAAAEIRLLVADRAPATLLVPGARFELFEGQRRVAEGEVR